MILAVLGGRKLWQIRSPAWKLSLPRSRTGDTQVSEDVDGLRVTVRARLAARSGTQRGTRRLRIADTPTCRLPVCGGVLVGWGQRWPCCMSRCLDVRMGPGSWLHGRFRWTHRFWRLHFKIKRCPLRKCGLDPELPGSQATHCEQDKPQRNQGPGCNDKERHLNPSKARRSAGLNHRWV